MDKNLGCKQLHCHFVYKSIFFIGMVVKNAMI